MNHDKYFSEDELNRISDLKGKHYLDSTELDEDEIIVKEQDEIFLELSETVMSTMAFIDKIMSVIKKELDLYDALCDDNEFKKAMQNQIKYVISCSKLKEELNETLKLIFKFSKTENYYWKDCSCEVYIYYYNVIKNEFLKSNSFANEIDFIKFEYERLLSENDSDSNITDSQFLNRDYFLSMNYRKYFSDENKQFFELEKSKKLSFLKNELGHLGFGLEPYTLGSSIKIKIIELESAKLEKLSLSNLPNFNVRQRYELYKKFGFNAIIEKLEAPQMSKYKMTALIMGISPDNAKQLHNETYREINQKDSDELKNYLINQSVK
ncbi:hypothetical protein SGQ44_00600 [Flavobacterium sp. Fl-77]|uniref:Uncharacterized protein n=1 Tax=Flavobacterium flavipigmentatum TaxID=2893884 RepID=A0AAJ2S632_9FLAO|nr:MULTISPECIES: hypothetical protein [unclassified Flavobacterium]MDX6180632.1 hypothetical protein [Flavobacterium sp. Fl-33]MDX6184232.1 hypothetical protein [Flavobacterium sp. Fl-77]UFH39344.1 hypothetical protein LNP22_03500 [Flavobacterium sp. F-70]